MALERTDFLTDEGPSRFDLMLALFDRDYKRQNREVSFRMARMMHRSLVKKTLCGDGWFSAVIFGAIHRETSMDSQPDVYEITGKTFLSGEGETNFRGIYNCATRQGNFLFEPKKERKEGEVTTKRNE